MSSDGRVGWRPSHYHVKEGYLFSLFDHVTAYRICSTAPSWRMLRRPLEDRTAASRPTECTGTVAPPPLTAASRDRSTVATRHSSRHSSPRCPRPVFLADVAAVVVVAAAAVACAGSSVSCGPCRTWTSARAGTTCAHAPSRRASSATMRCPNHCSFGRRRSRSRRRCSAWWQRECRRLVATATGFRPGCWPCAVGCRSPAGRFRLTTSRGDMSWPTTTLLYTGRRTGAAVPGPDGQPSLPGAAEARDRSAAGIGRIRRRRSSPWRPCPGWDRPSPSDWSRADASAAPDLKAIYMFRRSDIILCLSSYLWWLSRI